MIDAEGTFKNLHRVLANIAGARLFTITRIDHAQGLARRIFTSHPVDYPVAGAKPVTADGWTRQVIDAQQSFVANTTPAFAVFFADHALINRLGCSAALNVPIVDVGRVIATINVLDNEGRFTPAIVAAVEAAVAQDHDDIVNAIKAVPLNP